MASTTATSTSATGAETVRALVESGSEPRWLADWRQAAWEQYVETPLPDRVAHLWRYSEPERFLTDRVTPIVPNGSGASGEAVVATPDDPGLGEAAATIAFVDGRLDSLSVAAQWSEAGLILADLRVAAAEHEDLVREHLGAAIGGDAGKFEALNAAQFAGAAFLYVPKGLAVDQPIHVTCVGSQDLAALMQRVLIVVDDGAEATVIDEYRTPAGATARLIANSVVEGQLGKNARLSYFNIQRWGPQVRSHARQRFVVGRDASVTTVNIGLGGRYNKADLSNVQAGPNAQSEMIGVVFGSGGQHFDNHTEHIHRVGNSFSDMDFKVVLEQESRSVYTGLIRIDLDARNSEAYQENRNLMLDPTCRAESIPELEILNEEVRCTHGATVGPIDEEQVYYLMTRGLSRRHAEKLIVEGFFGPALDRIEDDVLRGRLWSYIDAKLAEGA